MVASLLPEYIDVDGQPPALLWEAVYRDYQPRIHGYLVSRVGPDEAQDLTQETFLRAGAALARMTGELHLSPWLYRIATNLVNDLLRRRQVVTWSSVDLWEEERTAEYPAVQGDDPAEQVSEDDCVRAALGQLSDGYRQALLLHAYEGYNGAQGLTNLMWLKKR